MNTALERPALKFCPALTINVSERFAVPLTHLWIQVAFFVGNVWPNPSSVRSATGGNSQCTSPLVLGGTSIFQLQRKQPNLGVVFLFGCSSRKPYLGCLFQIYVFPIVSNVFYFFSGWLLSVSELSFLVSEEQTQVLDSWTPRTGKIWAPEKLEWCSDSVVLKGIFYPGWSTRGTPPGAAALHWAQWHHSHMPWR